MGRRHVAESVDVEGGWVLRGGGEAAPLSRAPRHHVRGRLRPLSGPRRGQRGERRQAATAAGDRWTRGTIAESWILVMASAGGTARIVSPPVGKVRSDTSGFSGMKREKFAVQPIAGRRLINSVTWYN